MSFKLITYEKAKLEIKQLQTYVELVEGYGVDIPEKWIIKEYAITNSIAKIVITATEQDITTSADKPLDREYITNIINGKITDDLHRILRRGYREKIKPNKRNYRSIY